MTATHLDVGEGVFRVPRRAFTDRAIFESERARIFDSTWLYLGHASELDRPGDYVSRTVAGRALIFSRDRQGTLMALQRFAAELRAAGQRERRSRKANP